VATAHNATRARLRFGVADLPSTDRSCLVGKYLPKPVLGIEKHCAVSQD
jgi:hypothetical protein